MHPVKISQLRSRFTCKLILSEWKIHYSENGNIINPIEAINEPMGVANSSQ